jgi:hypothetical protein
MATRRNVYTGTAPANPVAIITPVMAGKTGMRMLGSAAEVAANAVTVSRRNLAPAGKAALGALTGTPGIASNYLSFDADVNNIDTGTPETDTMTIMALFRRTPGAAWTSSNPSICPVAVSNLEISASDGKTRGVGIWLYYTGATTGGLRAGGSYLDGSAAPAQVVNSISIAGNMDTWRIAALVITPTKPTTYDLTLGSSLGTATPVTTTRAKGTRNLLVGGAANTYGGLADVAFAQSWSTALSATDLRNEALKLQALAASRGITVGVT